MNDRTFHGGIEHLRDPGRVASLEVERVVDFSLEGIEAKNALDVSTGSGIFAEAFAARGLGVAGIDTNPEMVAVAGEHVPCGDFREAPVEAIPYPDGSFDLVFLGHILHEVDDMVKALREARRVAQQRVIVLEWPYRDEEKGPPLAHRLKPEQVTALAEEVGFERIETVPLTHMVLFRLSR